VQNLRAVYTFRLLAVLHVYYDISTQPIHDPASNSKTNYQRTLSMCFQVTVYMVLKEFQIKPQLCRAWLLKVKKRLE